MGLGDFYSEILQILYNLIHTFLMILINKIKIMSELYKIIKMLCEKMLQPKNVMRKLSV